MTDTKSTSSHYGRQSICMPGLHCADDVLLNDTPIQLVIVDSEDSDAYKTADEGHDKKAMVLPMMPIQI